MQFLTDKQLAERYAVTRPTPWRWVKTRNFPCPIRLSAGCTRWRLEDVEKWEAEQARHEAAA